MLTTLLFAALLGMVAWLAVPLLGWGLNGRLRALGRVYLLVAAATIGRNAISVSENLDLEWKRSTFDDELGRDVVTLGGVRKVVEDPADAIHGLFGFPFVFADEVRGVFYDLRHAAVGAEAKRLRDDGTLVCQAVRQNGGQLSVAEYPRAFFEFDRAQTRLVSLPGVRHLVGGDEDPAAAERVDQSVEKMFADQDSRTPFFRLLMPIGAAVGAWLLVWAIASNTGGGSGTTTIGIGPGSSILLLSGPGILPWLRRQARRVRAALWSGGARTGERLRRVWRWLAVVLGGGAATVLVGWWLIRTFGGVGAALVSAAFVGGMLALPITAFVVGQLVTAVAELAGQLWARLGFGTFAAPVIYLTDELRYEVREADSLDIDEQRSTEWYTLCKQRVGFATTFDELTFADAGYDAAGAEDYRDAVATDGGTDALPRGYELTAALQTADMKGFVPESLYPDTLYVRTDQFCRDWWDARTGHTIWRQQKESTQEYGGGTGGLSDRLLLLSSLAMFVVNVFVAGWFFS